MENYAVFKALHLLGVSLFIGNILVTALWKVLADRNAQPAVVAYAQRLVTITDYVFAAVGAGLVFVSGRFLAEGLYGGVNADSPSWLLWGWGLFIVSGVIWVLVLIPVQYKQAKMAREFASAEAVPEAYWRLSKIWVVAGVIATVLPLLNFYVMVFKP